MIELPEDDDELMAELGELLRREDPLPDAVVAGARGALVWRTVDTELASLSADSLLDAVAGVRGDAQRQLTFDSRRLTVEVDVDAGHLVGQVVPPQRGHVELEGPRVQQAADTDALGQFSLPATRGPVRIRFRGDDGEIVVTEWVTL